MKVDETIVETSILAPIGSALIEPDTKIIQSNNWYQVITPSVKEVSANEVILSRIPDNDVPSKIEATFEVYQKLGLPFKWCIGPMANRAAIEPIIQPRAHNSWPYRGMVIESQIEVLAPENVQVVRVDSGNFDQFLDLFLEGWDTEKFRDLARSKLQNILDPKSKFHYYLSSLNGVPVGAAGTVIKEGYGYLVSAVVLKKFRGNGVYRGLLKARLKDLHHRKMRFAVTHAREATSAPILEKLGFQTTFRAQIYTFENR